MFFKHVTFKFEDIKCAFSPWLTDPGGVGGDGVSGGIGDGAESKKEMHLGCRCAFIN